MSAYSKKYPVTEGVYHVRLCADPSTRETVLARIIEGDLAVTFALFRRRGSQREYTQSNIGRWYKLSELMKEVGFGVFEWRKVRIR